ncbi:hypothetical protein Sgou_02980 [Streptomyces gougerotii]|uniref:Uncharacterized protein n=1 Tax=Streptomyces gougerotii TaxID=53448 RepID=A0A8H9HE98_9ACTN|nr:hypothetical protein Srut_26720 [Streptomyces rutgersensis]GFH75628.1 hypothetical protein Sgou_02980 [Streptomyces gougerotii]GGU59746.1 hypothetical protein GCM10010227_11430 [Streptomyces gougerotii]
MKDRRGLVQHQPGPDAEDDGGGPRAEALPAAADRAGPAGHHEDHAGHHVVDVRTAGGHVVEGAVARADQPGDGADDDEGQDEGGRRVLRGRQRRFPRIDGVPVPPRPRAAPFRPAAPPAPPRAAADRGACSSVRRTPLRFAR